MKPIWEAWFCQIEITNHCHLACPYCSRYVRHIRPDQRFHMELDFFEKALDSLEGFRGRIGIIGGEPTLHPRFPEICEILRGRYSRDRVGLWSAGGPKWEKHKALAGSTFGFIAFNQHDEQQKQVCMHQPATLAICEAVPDPVLRQQLIDDCWVQRTWCPSIAPKGAFFCEVAYSLDVILDGPGGYPVEPGWWRKSPEQFRDQVDRYCQNCGMAVPIQRKLLAEQQEEFTPGLYELFCAHGLPRLDPGWVAVKDIRLSNDEIEKNKKTWYPGNYRGDLYDDPRCPEGRGSTT